MKQQQQQQQQQQGSAHQQQKRSLALDQWQQSDFKRFLSLQQRRSRPRRSRPQAAAPHVKSIYSTQQPLPPEPPPLPPRGARQRTNSEFSAIVLDVNRLFHENRDFEVGSSKSPTSSDIADSTYGGGESDDESGALENDDGDDPHFHLQEASGAEVDAAAAAASAARDEAAAEMEEAEDVYSEIPPRAAIGGAVAFGRRGPPRPSTYPQASRALLDTLETLKTPTIPDSDPDSPIYTSDCDDRLGELMRNHSSLMLSAGEESTFSGLGRVDAQQHQQYQHRRASPVIGSHHLLSAPEHYRRLSHSSRQSVVSLQPPGGRADRRISRASRAVKLDYAFNSSSGKVSLQKLGAQSLSRLEDMAQIGNTEQGTNYKRSYVSIYKPLHPLFLALKLFGVFHTRQKGGKTAAKFTHSYIYSGLVMLALWFNVLRYLLVYDWGQEKFDSLLFLKMTHHVIYIQAAVASTVMFRASRSFPRFFKACHEFMSRRHNLTYQYTLRTRAKVTAAIGFAVVILELSVFLTWMVQADSEYFKTFLRPYTYIVPWNDATKGVMGFCHFAFDFFMAAAWVFPALLFCNFTWIFEREFRFLAHRLKLACTNEHIFVGDIEKFRLESWKISKLVAKFDDLFNFYVFTVFITDILSACLILYNLIVGRFPGNGIIVEVWFWLVSALVRLFGVTISAARVNQAACSPLNVIQNMNLREYAVNPAKVGQLMIFLNKLTIGNIGFTAWNLFTLSRTSTMTIAAMIITYTVLFVKLGASYGQEDRLRPTTTVVHATTMANDYASTGATTFAPYY